MTFIIISLIAYQAMFIYEYDLCTGIASPGQVQDQKLCLDPFTLQKNPILFQLSNANV